MFQLVSLTFEELNIESNSACSYDSVSVYDGASDNAPLLSKFCDVVTSTILSSGSSLFVVFQTDHSINTGRFSLNWSIIIVD